MKFHPKYEHIKKGSDLLENYFLPAGITQIESITENCT